MHHIKQIVNNTEYISNERHKIRDISNIVPYHYIIGIIIKETNSINRIIFFLNSKSK